MRSALIAAVVGLMLAGCGSRESGEAGAPAAPPPGSGAAGSPQPPPAGGAGAAAAAANAAAATARGAPAAAPPLDPAAAGQIRNFEDQLRQMERVFADLKQVQERVRDQVLGEKLQDIDTSLDVARTRLEEIRRGLAGDDMNQIRAEWEQLLWQTKKICKEALARRAEIQGGG